MKQKVIKIIFCAMIVSTLSIQPLLAAGKTTKIKVTFVSAELIENNSVGNEWWWGGYINGKEVEEGDTVVLNLKSTDTIKLKAEAQEQDKYPDDGAANATVRVSSITNKAINKSMNVTVVENRGRYSGNVAKVKFIFKIQKG